MVEITQRQRRKLYDVTPQMIFSWLKLRDCYFRALSQMTSCKSLKLPQSLSQADAHENFRAINYIFSYGARLLFHFSQLYEFICVNFGIRASITIFREHEMTKNALRRISLSAAAVARVRPCIWINLFSLCFSLRVTDSTQRFNSSGVAPACALTSRKTTRRRRCSFFFI